MQKAMVITITCIIHTILIIMITDDEIQSHLRLLQFLSPGLPVGSYSFSQGLEWAVENNWVNSEESFRCWIEEQIASNLGEQELPVLARLYDAVASHDIDAFNFWSQFSVALRDTAELRQEELDRGEAYYRVLRTIESISCSWPTSAFIRTPLASISWFAVQNHIDKQALLTAFAHNWLETSVVTGVKLIPLGQSAGQKIVYDLSPHLITAISRSTTINDDDIGISLPALSMASAGHEVQYTRVYRS